LKFMYYVHVKENWRYLFVFIHKYCTNILCPRPSDISGPFDYDVRSPFSLCKGMNLIDISNSVNICPA